MNKSTPLNNRWQDSLPDKWKVKHVGEDGQERDIPLREHPSLKDYKTKDEAVKALVHAQRLLGKTPEGYIRIPDDSASPDDVASFYASLGRPEQPTAYALPDFDLPEGFELQEEILDGFRYRAHELGLTPKQVAGLYEWFLPIVLDTHHQLENETSKLRESELESLRTVHRGDTPTMLDNALRAAEAIGGPELLAALDKTGAGDHAAVINAFAKIAPLVLESGMRGSNRGWGEELSREKLMEMMKDPRYSDPHKRDKAYVKKVTEGFQQLYPGNYAAGDQF